MSSFYGGRRGASFEIVKRYVTFAQMEADIKNIDYNQYVVVEDGNKIYRRVLGTPGYEYIMSVDPSNISTSLASSLKVLDYSEVEKLSSDPSYSEGDAEIVDSSYNLIKYNSVLNADGTTSLGFSFPSYGLDLELLENAAKTELKRVDDLSNPFYSKWQLSIKDLIARSFSNLRLVNSQSVTETVYSSLDYTTIVTLPENASVILYDIEENGKKTIYFGSFNTISNVSLSDTGLLTIGTLDKQLSYQFTDIADTTFEAGILNFIYKDGSNKEFNVNYPKEIKMNEDYSLFTVYADGTEEKISESINYILDTKIENNHLFIKYSDKTYKQDEQTEDGYIDYGSVKSDSGILVGKNYNVSEISSSFSITETINFLNTNHPNGLTGEGLEGKVITVGNSNANKHFFAFNYESKSWYYLGTIGQSGITNLVAPYTSDNYDIALSLPEGGIWFIGED